MKNELKPEKVLKVAAITFMRRKKRLTYPEGGFNYNGIWYPHKSEVQDCCSQVRAPSKRWPYTLSQHCCTAMHVANRYRVSRTDLLSVAKTLTDADLDE